LLKGNLCLAGALLKIAGLTNFLRPLAKNDGGISTAPCDRRRLRFPAATLPSARLWARRRHVVCR
jgi:hypothetical protein